jgi:hypothetical protein
VVSQGDPPPNATSLVEVLQERAAGAPDDLALIYLSVAIARQPGSA